MDASEAVIILNYRRPQNIGALTAAARAALPQAAIFVLDQAEEDGLRERRDIAWDQIWFQRAANRGAGARVALASALPFDHWIAIDDDTLLTAEQIRRLAERLRAEPDRAHGVWGQRLELEQGQVGFRNGLHRMDAAMSTLNQAYAFSRAQARAAIALSARVGFASWDDIGPVDDFLLSCGSAKPPLCHDLGPIALCPSHNERGVALWLSDGFYERRVDIARRLLAAQAIAVFSPLTVNAAGAQGAAAEGAQP
jgi:hypothetical protein